MKRQVIGKQDSSAPKQLIAVDAHGKFTVNEKAAAQISSLEGPITPVCVAGNYRTGKSFLLNCLTETMFGDKKSRMKENTPSVSASASAFRPDFAVGESTNACTRGIWMWCNPQAMVGADGAVRNVIFLDTEGLASMDQGQTHDTQIFALSVLLSSCFLYNTVGTIDERALDALAMVTHLASKVHQSHSSDPGATTDDFPHFLWIVRDFALTLKDEKGAKITSSQYLENALRDVSGASQSAEEKNRIRHVLKSMFLARNCETLVRPSVDEEQLQQLQSLASSGIRKEFTSGIHRIVSWLSQHAQPKTVGRVQMTGRMYVALARSYVEAMNGGAVPNIATALQSAIESEARNALEQSFEVFSEELRGSLAGKGPFGLEAIRTAYEQARKSAMRVWDNVMGETQSPAHLGQLNKEMERVFSERVENDKMGSLNHCREVADQTIMKIKSAPATEDSTAFLQATAAALKEYVIQSKGDSAYKVCVEVLIPAMLESVGERTTKLESSHAQKLQEAAHNLSITNEKLKAAQHEAKVATKQTAGLQSQLDSTLAELLQAKEELAASRVTATANQEELRQLERALGKERQTCAEATTTAEHLTAEVAALKQALEKARQDTMKETNAMSEKQAALLADQEETSTKLKAATAQVAKLKAELKEAKALSDQMGLESEEGMSSLKEQLRDALRAMTEQRERADEVEAKVSELKTENKKLKKVAKEGEAVEGLKAELATVKASEAKVREELEQSEEMLLDLRETATKDSDKLSSEIASLKAAKRDLEAAKRKLESERNDLASDKVALEARCKELSSRPIAHTSPTPEPMRPAVEEDVTPFKPPRASGGGKRKREEEVVDLPSPEPQGNSRRSSVGSTSSVLFEEVDFNSPRYKKSRYSRGLAAPPPQILTEDELKGKTIAQLRSLMTSLDIPLPQHKVKKTDLIALYLEGAKDL